MDESFSPVLITANGCFLTKEECDIFGIHIVKIPKNKLSKKLKTSYCDHVTAAKIFKENTL